MNSDVNSLEIIDATELANRWSLPESWVRDQVRSRATDPIPCLRFGKYVRFQWGHPDLTKWWSGGATVRVENGSIALAIHIC